jgi:hypothetical protein
MRPRRDKQDRRRDDNCDTESSFDGSNDGNIDGGQDLPQADIKRVESGIDPIHPSINSSRIDPGFGFACL